jgi:hypothetical protein
MRSDIASLPKTLAAPLLRLQGYSVRQIASLLRVSFKTIYRLCNLDSTAILLELQKLRAAGKLAEDDFNRLVKLISPAKAPSRRGRPSTLQQSHIEFIAALNTNPTTQHLSLRKKYELMIQNTQPPHPSYHTIYRYFQQFPEAFKRKKRERFLSAHHPANVLPGEVWLIDRFKADVFVLDPLSGEVARPECIAIIDKATRAILAIGAAYRKEQDTTRKRFHYDAHLAGSAILAAARGHITNTPHLPRKLIFDWGKVEGADRIIHFLTYHHVELIRARPYTPHDKAEIEGGVIAHIHAQLDATLPGYCGPDNQRDRMPSCWDGKPHRIITAKGIYYTDAAGRPLLTIDEYNQELQRFAQEWNNQPTSDDIRYRHIPRIARLKNATTPTPDADLQFAETYLLPGATRTVYKDGTISIGNRRYYHPALVALRAIYGNEAKVYARYTITNRNVVYLYYIHPHKPTDIPTEWLWFLDDPHTPSRHPWYRSQATYYNRDEHYEYDPQHQAWVAFTQAINRTARRAINEAIHIPITDHLRLFQFVMAHIWHTTEQYLPNLLRSDNASQGAEAGECANTDGTNGYCTEAPHALISPITTHPLEASAQPTTSQPQNPQMNLWEIERAAMRKRQELARAWRQKRWSNGG